MAGLRDAMSDLAETIRRVFKPPPCHAAPMGYARPGFSQVPPLAARALPGFEPARAVTVAEALLRGAAPVAVGLAWTATVVAEPGWQAWEAGAKVSVLPTFRTDTCIRLAVPPLPRRVETRREPVGIPAPRAHQAWNPLAAPGGRPVPLDLGRPRTFRGLEQMMGLPVAVRGEDLGRISKALWMRYTLQMVRATGENIRNLEVLGLYLIPAKGTRQIRHDPATGRLLVTLGPEAVGAARSPFMLARRKTDAEIVCCFVEER